MARLRGLRFFFVYLCFSGRLIEYLDPLMTHGPLIDIRNLRCK